MCVLEKVEAKIFDNIVDWRSIDKEKALENTYVLDLIREACLIESYFSIYVGHMINLFWYDVDATSIFTIEAFEAYSHYFILRKYLDIVGYRPITNDDIINLRKKDKDIRYNDEIKELVNFMATEHFAANFFKDLSDMTTEKVLRSILIKLSNEEVTHSQFAYDLLSARLKRNPKIKKEILLNAKSFKHIGEYVLTSISKVKDDNLRIIQSFNNKIKNLVGESVSDYLIKNE